MANVKGYVGAEKEKFSVADLLKMKKRIKKEDAELNKLMKDGEKSSKRSFKVLQGISYIGYSIGLFSLLVGFAFNSLPWLSKINVLVGTFLITHTFIGLKDAKKAYVNNRLRVCGLAYMSKTLSKKQIEDIDKNLAELKSGGKKR